MGWRDSRGCPLTCCYRPRWETTKSCPQGPRRPGAGLAGRAFQLRRQTCQFMSQTLSVNDSDLAIRAVEGAATVGLEAGDGAPTADAGLTLLAVDVVVVLVLADLAEDVYVLLVGDG